MEKIEMWQSEDGTIYATEEECLQEEVILLAEQYRNDACYSVNSQKLTDETFGEVLSRIEKCHEKIIQLAMKLHCLDKSDHEYTNSATG